MNHVPVYKNGVRENGTVASARMAGAIHLWGISCEPEKEQAFLRILIGSLALYIYLGFALAGHFAQMDATLLMVTGYVAFGIVTYGAVVARPGLSRPRLALTTVTDQAMAIGALAVGGNTALPLLFAIFSFLVGAGCRYGKQPLSVSCAVAVAGLVFLMNQQPWWIENRAAGIGLLLSVVATSIYMFAFVSKMERRAAIDNLTGLNNRASLESAIAQTHASMSARENAALLLIGLDGFKEVNDAHGHVVGDRHAGGQAGDHAKA